MNPTNQQLQPKLRYSQQLASLKNNEVAIFTQANIDTILSSQDFPANADCVLKYIDLLKQNFNGDQIACASIYGQKNLLALIGLYPFLKNDFSANHIIRVVNSDCGASALGALYDTYRYFISLGFTKDQLIDIASDDFGDANLINLKTHIPQLLKFKFTIQDMVNIANKRRSYQIISLLTKNFDLLTSFNLNTAQLFTIINSTYADLHLDMLEVNYQHLANLGFTHFDIKRILCNGEGYKTLKIVINKHQRLHELGFKNEHIAFMVDCNSGFKNIEYVLANIKQIKKCGFTMEKFLRIIVTSYGIKSLNAIFEYHEILKHHLKLTNDHFVTLGITTTGGDIITLMAKHINYLVNLNLDIDLLVRKLTNHINSLNFLKSLILNAEMMVEHNFTGDQMLTLLYESGSTSLDDALLFSQAINDPKLIVEYLSMGPVGKTCLSRMLVQNITGVDPMQSMNSTQIQEYAIFLIRRGNKVKLDQIERAPQTYNTTQKRKDCSTSPFSQNDQAKKRKHENDKRLVEEIVEGNVEENNPREFGLQENSSAPTDSYTDQEILQMVYEAARRVAQETTSVSDLPSQQNPIDANHINTVSQGLQMLDAITNTEIHVSPNQHENENLANDKNTQQEAHEIAAQIMVDVQNLEWVDVSEKSSLQQHSMFKEKELEVLDESAFEVWELPDTPEITSHTNKI